MRGFLIFLKNKKNPILSTGDLVSDSDKVAEKLLISLLKANFSLQIIEWWVDDEWWE